MARTRVHELARLLGVESSKVMEILSGLGSTAANHMAELSDQEASGVRAALTREALLKQRQAQQARQPEGIGQPQAKVVQRARPVQPAPAVPPIQKARAVPSPAQGPAPVVRRAEAPAQPAPEPGKARTVSATAAPSELSQAPVDAPAAAAQPATNAPATTQAQAPAAQPVAPAQRQGDAQRPQAAGAGAARRDGPSRRPPARPAPGPARAAIDPEAPAGDEAGAADSRTAPARGRPARPAGQTGAAANRRKPGAAGARTVARPRTNAPRGRSSGRRGRGARQIAEAKRPIRKTTIMIEGPVTVKQLAADIGAPMAEAVKTLMGMGIMANVNQTLDVDIARKLAAELGAQVENAEAQAADDGAKVEIKEKASKFLLERPPVITVMGHVDHGKTTLLDTIRRSNVVAQEAGGITQHIGASVVNWNGKKLVFIDTPGHEAFTAMRARGAKVTDVVILVVAADDGVKPQTTEAVNHIKAAKVPMIVAVNKIDRPGADPERVKRQLSEQGVVPEDWGGDTVFVEVSALKGDGVNTLLEMITLVTEMQELKANPVRPAKGTVIEAKLDRSRGPVATVLVQTGTLRVGDTVVAGATTGRVRALYDYRGERLDQAGPSQPAEILGLGDVPEAGEQFEVVEDEKIAREMTSRVAGERRNEQTARTLLSLEDLYQNIKSGTIKDLNIVIKADVQGSLEALSSTLNAMTLPEVRLHVLHGGVGPITESDVMLATASNAVVIGYNVRPDANARRVAQQEQVDIRSYQIIYEILDDITAAAKGMLEPKMHKVLVGKAQVRAMFSVPKVGMVAGCYVQDGRITRNSEVRVLRNGVVLHEGKLSSLKRFKDDVREVQSGFECGIGVDGFEKFEEGDVIEAYLTERVERAS
jgi:translation initiation factor IF-2